MGYRLIQDETLPRGLKRIARDEIDSAIDHLGTKDPSKREVRDAAALVEAVDLLSRHTRRAAHLEQLADLRRALQKRGRQTLAHADVEVIMEGGIIGLREVKRHIAVWVLEDNFDAVAPGLRRSYKRGRKALRVAHSEPTSENFHTLRKRVKDRWYQVRVFEGLWNHPANSPEKRLAELQEDLGDDHNLEVLRAFIPSESPSLLRLIDETQHKLREKSLTAADEMYAARSSEYAGGLNALWDEWRPAPRGAKTSARAVRRTTSAA
jgi:CHAD domain-containing protein